MKIDVVFVCQQGELEVMSALLAASLRYHCDDNVHLHVIEPIPQKEYGAVSPRVRKFLENFGAKWYHFTNPVSDDYKIFNKINAFNIDPVSDKILFLDTDVVIRKPFIRQLQPFMNRPFAAMSAGKQRFSANAADWEPVYRLFDLAVPRMRWPVLDSLKWGPPYINAGVMLVDASIDFSSLWIDTCKRIHFEESLNIANRNTVQIGLPVALHRGNIPYALIDKRFNFGLSKGWRENPRLQSDENALIVHYFKPKNLTLDPVIHQEVQQLVRQFHLEDIFEIAPRWKKLLKSFRSTDVRQTISFPRTRASIFNPNDLKTFSQSISAQNDDPQKKTAGKSISKKRQVFIVNIPGCDVEFFAQWFKKCAFDNVELKTGIDATGGNSRQSLNFLPEILKDYPDALIFFVIQNPFAVIAKWMTAHGNIHAFFDENYIALLSEKQKNYLMALQKLDDPAMQRAGLWLHFAELTNENIPGLHVIRFEDLIENPNAVKNFIAQKLSRTGQEIPEINTPVDRESSNSILSNWDKECIRMICQTAASPFGYYLFDEQTEKEEIE